MKKEIVILLAVAGMFAGCQQRDTEYNEPAGADRPMRTNEASTNQINESSGAATTPQSSQQSDSQQQQQSGTQSNP